MASRPPQPPLPLRQQSSQQRASSPATPEASHFHEQRRSSIPQSATSEDSQTVFLNHPSSEESSPKPELRQRQISPRSMPRKTPTDTDPRTCWICFSDETEDDPTSSEWRSPCPCALTAHEACLLDWVADLESPKNQRKGPPKIQCPQCKANIAIARPRSLVVEAVQAVERATGRLILPFVGVTLAGTVITGCWMHGFSTVYLIFGPEDAEALMGIDRHMGIGSNWGLALPFVPIALVASRGTWGDSIFPILPLIYFASNTPVRDNGSLWPPSVAMTMATLPYIRAAYNEFYARILAPKEKAWTKEIQPRAGEAGDGDTDQDNEDVNIEVPQGLNFELDVQVEIIEEEEVPEDGQQQHGPPADVPPAVEPAGAADANDPDQIRERVQQDLRERHGPARHHHGHNHVHEPGVGVGAVPGEALLLRPRQTAASLISALIFPTVAAAMGALLKVILPRSWTNHPRYWERYPAGFLTSRFGRSIAGGCLFLVLRDTVSLYSKYQRAQNHKQRKIVDYQGRSKARKTEANTS